MDIETQREIEDIKSELQKIVDALYGISGSIKRDFSGIGNEKCAASLENSARHYADVKNRLNKMDASEVTDEYKALHQPAPAPAPVQKASTTSTNTNTSTSNQSSSSKTNTSSSTTSSSTKTGSTSSSQSSSKPTSSLNSISNFFKGLFK